MGSQVEWDLDFSATNGIHFYENGWLFGGARREKIKINSLTVV
jgi:hypothetical protein